LTCWEDVLKGLQDLQGLLDVWVGRKWGIEDVSYRALLVDDKCYPPRDETPCGLDAIEIPDPSLSVAQEGKGELVAMGELFVGLGRVGTDTDDDGPGLKKIFIMIPKTTGLRRADPCPIFGVEKEDDRLCAENFFEMKNLSRCLFEGEGGGPLSDPDFAHKGFMASMGEEVNNIPSWQEGRSLIHSPFL